MILFHHKAKWHLLKIPTVYMQATINIFCLFIRVHDVTYAEIQFNRSRLCNFISSWKMVKAPENFIIGGVFSLKVTKNAKKTRGDMFYTFAGMTSHKLNAKLCNYIISWNLMRPPRNFIHRSFSIQLNKICQKRDEALASIPLQRNFEKQEIYSCFKD